jgi:hypothetical protein
MHGKVGKSEAFLHIEPDPKSNQFYLMKSTNVSLFKITKALSFIEFGTR